MKGVIEILSMDAKRFIVALFVGMIVYFIIYELPIVIYKFSNKNKRKDKNNAKTCKDDSR